VPVRPLGTALWDIALPTGRRRLAASSMAGFRLRREAGLLDLRTVPQPSVLLAVEFGERPLLVADRAGAVHRGSVAAGLSTEALRVRGSGLELVQVRLSPLVAGAVLGVPPSALDGGVVTLDELWGRDAERLRAQLQEASWPERFALLDAALARRHDAGPRLDPETAEAWDTIMRTRGRLRVEDLVDATGWSRKRLWSRFRTQIGLPPKRAAPLARFDLAGHRLAAGVRAARVAAEGGYADQSHLHRDVVGFAGATPGHLATSPWLEADEVAWPDRRSHLSVRAG
jgi:AraC-like DNA-binding protein